MSIFSSVGVATPGGTGVLAPLRSSSPWSVGAACQLNSSSALQLLTAWTTRVDLPRQLTGSRPVSQWGKPQLILTSVGAEELALEAFRRHA